MSLNEIANTSPEARELLCGSAGHTEVARQLGVSETAVRRWRARNADNYGPAETGVYINENVMCDPATIGLTFSTEDREQLHEKLDELLDQANTDPGSVKSMRVATWDGMIKNEQNKPEIVRQYGVRLETAKWAPSWPVIQQATPVSITRQYEPPAPRRYAPGPNSQEKIAVILPDTQIGFRQYENGDYDPFHDIKAIDVALRIVEDIDPDQVILLGDYLDLPTFGKYEQEAAFARTTQRAINYGYQLLVSIKAVAPYAKIIMLEGNHDRRLEKMVTRNAMEAFGLRRADDIDGWPVLSLPHLLRLSELGVEYVGGYPAGSYWINDRLKCVHGNVVRSNGSTAKAVVDEERVSVIFGHIHRVETQYKTVDIREGGRTRLAHTPGCLCRIDGAVPSVHGSTDLQGKPISRYENWQQGLSVITYRDGDEPFSLESVFINTADRYRAVYNGNVYLA